LVLLAAYNGAAWISQQLESTLAQRGVSLHVVVRDDVSGDGTKTELLRFEGDARIRLIFEPQRAGSAAGNFLRLMQLCPSDGFDFVALADQDDIWYPDKLARACGTLRAQAAAGYSSATLASWESGRTALVKLSGNENRSDFLFEGAGQGCTFVVTAAFYERARRLLLERPEITRDLHFHDWALYALARAWDLRWSLDPEPSMVYRQHAGNDTGARGSWRGAVRRLALIRRGWYRRQLTAICALCAAAAPRNEVIAAWQAILGERRGFGRRLRMIRFCLRGGRRRAGDNFIVLLAAGAGWI
jgi:rhamnosyltransferase